MNEPIIYNPVFNCFKKISNSFHSIISLYLLYNEIIMKSLTLLFKKRYEMR